MPYLTHQDFAKQIRELSDVCDYVVISLSTGGTGNAKSNGLNQYYYNPSALHKMLRYISKARVNELGKIAAFEFEQALEDTDDYDECVKKYYRRMAIVTKT